MSALRNIRMLSRHAQWANKRLHDALAQLPNEVLHVARPGRPQGMIGVLGHIYVVDLIWKAHLLGIDHGFHSRALERQTDLAELMRQQAEADQWYITHVDALPEEALGEEVHFRFVDGGPGRMRRGDILLHIVQHKTYHRGYVADMLYELGSKPPTMDLPVFLRDVPRSK